MKPEIKTYSYDIKEAIELIEIFIQNNNDFDDYKNDIKTKKAVEREFEIIGEAVDRINKLGSNTAISNKRKIINMRNKISHGYDMISDATMWATIHKDLPILKIEVQKILD